MTILFLIGYQGFDMSNFKNIIGGIAKKKDHQPWPWGLSRGGGGRRAVGADAARRRRAILGDHGRAQRALEPRL